MRAIDVSTKDTYLKWVQEWKAAWHEIVAKILDAKYRKLFHRNKARRMQGWPGKETELKHHVAEMHKAEWQRLALRWQARKLHQARVNGKKLSWAAKQTTSEE